VSLLAVKFTLEFISSMINFGAPHRVQPVVNLTVIVFYAFRMGQRRTPQGDLHQHRAAIRRHVPPPACSG